MAWILHFCVTPGEYREDHVILVLSPSINPSPKISVVTGIQGGRIMKCCVFSSSHRRMMRKIPGFSPQLCTFYITRLKLCSALSSENFSLSWEIKPPSTSFRRWDFHKRLSSPSKSVNNSIATISNLRKVCHSFYTQNEYNMCTVCACSLINRDDSRSISEMKYTIDTNLLHMALLYRKIEFPLPSAPSSLIKQ